MQISHTHRLGFVHIPKTGGTSITAWCRSAGTWSPIGRIHDTVHHVAPRIRRTVQWFAVVRNPWDRLVSLYRYHVRYYRDRMAQPRLSRKPKYRDPWTLLQRGFEHWCRHPHTFANRAPDWYDYRYCPQALWVDSDTHILHQERLHTEFDWVRARTGSDQPLSRQNRTPGPLGSYREWYTPELRRWLQPRLQTDCDRFGYEW